MQLRREEADWIQAADGGGAVSVLVRCPSSVCLPDGTAARCGYQKRVESLDYDKSVGFNTYRCRNCGVRYYAWRDPDGSIWTEEYWL